MIKVQVSVTPNEAKQIIAKAVSQMPIVRNALKNGKIFLKGGTTISAVAEQLIGIKLPISGRITQKGTKSSTAEKPFSAFHRVIIDKGERKDIETDLEVQEVGVEMGKGDITIVGANALDIDRNAAIMIGRACGGTATFLPWLIGRGISTVIAVGWEKLIPCSIEDAVAAAGIAVIDVAMGMAVGLIPLQGIVVTETDALNILTGVKTTVIGAGGILGAEGSTTFVMEGKPYQVKEAWELINGVKGAAVSGEPDSLEECFPGCPFCNSHEDVGSKHIPTHRGCAYFRPNLAKKAFSTKD
jgi:hypothetical protein